MKRSGSLLALRSAWVGLALLVPASALGGGLRPVSLSASEEMHVWEGPQFVEADRTGNVFFFQASALKAYPLVKSGFLGEPLQLKSTVGTGSEVRNAVLGSSGDRWLVQTSRSVRLFVDGEEKPLPPLQWLATSVTFRRDDPVVAVLPFPLGGSSVNVKKLGTPPWILEAEDDRWGSLVDLKGVAVSDVMEGLGRGGFNDVMADHTVSMTSDRQGRLWVAKQYAYHLQRFSPSGRLLFEMTVDGGKVRKKAESQGIEIKRSGAAQNPAEATTNPEKEKSTYFAFTAEAAVLDLVEGRDGRLYLLVRQAGGEAFIDRYDPVLSLLERTPLQLKAEGRFTMAAGKDSLYLAAYNGKDGRWKIAWEALDQATWKEVEFKANGEPSAD